MSFVYRFPLTASLTGGGAAGFAGDAGAAEVGVLFAVLVAAAGGEVFGAFGVPGVDAGFVAGVVAAAPVAGVAAVGAGAAALAEVVAAAVGAGLLAAVTGADGATALAVSVFAGFAGALAGAALLPDSATASDVDALLTGGAGAAAVSVFTGFAGVAGFSVAGSGFLSASGLAPESVILIEATWSL